jgi:hypothetical protein
VSPPGVERAAVRKSVLIQRVGATPLDIKAGLEELRAHGLVCVTEMSEYVLGTELFRSWIERREHPPLPALRLSQNADDLTTLVEIIASLATSSLISVDDYFRDLLREAALPQAFMSERAGWMADAGANARLLVTWAESKGSNPLSPKCTILGSIVRVLYGRVGSDKYDILTRLVQRYELY